MTIIISSVPGHVSSPLAFGLTSHSIPAFVPPVLHPVVQVHPAADVHMPWPEQLFASHGSTAPPFQQVPGHGGAGGAPAADVPVKAAANEVQLPATRGISEATFLSCGGIRWAPCAVQPAVQLWTCPRCAPAQ